MSWRSKGKERKKRYVVRKKKWRGKHWSRDLREDCSLFHWTAITGDGSPQRQDEKNESPKRFPFSASLRNIRALLINILCFRQCVLLRWVFQMKVFKPAAPPDCLNEPRHSHTQKSGTTNMLVVFNKGKLLTTKLKYNNNTKAPSKITRSLIHHELHLYGVHGHYFLLTQCIASHFLNAKMTVTAKVNVHQ